jgi:Uma2 family endonuclease
VRPQRDVSSGVIAFAPVEAARPLPGDPNAPNDPAIEAAFRATPDDQVAEILDGELFTMPRPRPAHANAATVLGEALGPPFRRGRGGPGGWVFLVEPELHLGPRPDKVVPDLAGWRRERLPDTLLDADADGAITVAPDWVCEVLSDRTEHIDRGKKRRIYRRERVGHLWYLDPRDRTLEVHRIVEGRWLEVDTFEGDEVVRAEPFEAIELILGDLWRW